MNEKTLADFIQELGISQYENIGDDLLLFIKSELENHCDFWIIEMISFGGSRMENGKIRTMRFEENHAEIYISGAVFFDGIRHMNVGEEGYMHYVECRKMRTAINVIEKIERQYSS